MKSLLTMLFVLSASLSHAQESPLPIRMVETCLWPSATSTVLNKVGQGWCAVVAGLATQMPPNVAAVMLNGREIEMGQLAIAMSCIKNDVGRQAAIRLIQVCHCHSNSDREVIENNQGTIIDNLQMRGQCQ